MMPRRRSGVALVVVLWTVAMLATITAVASSAARSSAQVASNRRALATARAMAESGIIAASAFLADSLATFGSDSSRRTRFLNALEPTDGATPPSVQDTLGDGVFAVAFADISARLDINNADIDGMTTVFRSELADTEARRLASLIARRVLNDAAAADPATAASRARTTRDSLGASLLGQTERTGVRHPFESLDDLIELPGVDRGLLGRLAPLLTVDGDGSINERSAPAVVRAAATGSLVDRPTRLLVIARGWQRGHPLTREIQVVYDVSEGEPRMVRWRESSR